jgi:predicted nucleotidyltransferase
VALVVDGRRLDNGKAMSRSRTPSPATRKSRSSSRSWAIEEARRILLDALRGSKVAVYLYGSCARGDCSEFSDIDVAVESATPLPRGTLAKLREQLEESRIPYRVEVIDLNAVDPSFRRRVLEEGIRWSG